MSPVSEFDRALPKLLVHEGGKVNHPKDPGGATNKGVTQRTYNAWRKSKGLPIRSVFIMTDDECSAIYLSEYWNRIQGDKLPAGVSYVVFDGAVNSGVAQSIKWLQRALAELGLYAGPIDGILGQGTLTGLSGVNDNDALIAKILKRREAFLRQLKTFKTFGKGWMRRLADVLAVGQAWASGSVGPEISFIPGANAKAILTDAKTSPTVGVADAATGTGLATTSLGPMLKEAQEQIAPFAATSQFISTIMTALIVIGVVTTIGGLAYRLYAKHKNAKRLDALDLTVAA